jgi:hypothetical protein
MIQTYCFLTSSAGRKRSTDQTSSMAIWDMGPQLARLSQLRAFFGFFVMIFVFKSCVFIRGI